MNTTLSHQLRCLRKIDAMVIPDFWGLAVWTSARVELCESCAVDGCHEGERLFKQGIMVDVNKVGLDIYFTTAEHTLSKILVPMGCKHTGKVCGVIFSLPWTIPQPQLCGWKSTWVSCTRGHQANGILLHAPWHMC